MPRSGIVNQETTAMNMDALVLLEQMQARRLLLLSLPTSGFFVAQDRETKLCHGHVCKAFALVPVEHADHISTQELTTIRARGLDRYVRGISMVPLVEVVADELMRLDLEMSWVSECGGPL